MELLSGKRALIVRDYSIAVTAIACRRRLIRFYNHETVGIRLTPDPA